MKAYVNKDLCNARLGLYDKITPFYNWVFQDYLFLHLEPWAVGTGHVSQHKLNIQFKSINGSGPTFQIFMIFSFRSEIT